jgi:phosphotriesterase-related protein
VLGDRPATELGRCDHHEHLFQVSPLLTGDELDDEAASGREAAALRQAGIDSMIEATPAGLGRNPAAVARISVAAGLTVVHTSGAHRQEHYRSGHWILDRDVADLTARFTGEPEDRSVASSAGIAPLTRHVAVVRPLRRVTSAKKRALSLGMRRWFS